MIIQVKTIPNSSEDLLEKLEDGTYRARVRAPPDKGKANDSLKSLLSQHFGVGQGKIKIRNPSSRKKIVWIDELLNP